MKFFSLCGKNITQKICKLPGYCKKKFKRAKTRQKVSYGSDHLESKIYKHIFIGLLGVVAFFGGSFHQICLENAKKIPSLFPIVDHLMGNIPILFGYIIFNAAYNNIDKFKMFFTILLLQMNSMGF